MKKSFFLLTAVLTAILSFSACGGGGGGGGDSSDLEFVKVACDIQVGTLGSHCYELSGYFPSSEVSSQIAEGEEICLEAIEDFKGQISEVFPDATPIGTFTDKCEAADLECGPYSEDGEEFKLYLSGPLTMTWGGACPSEEELFGEE